jgi:hypothetical protein
MVVADTQCDFGLKAGVEKGVATATFTMLNPGPTAGKDAVYVSPTATADYTASCNLTTLPPMVTA